MSWLHQEIVVMLLNSSMCNIQMLSYSLRWSLLLPVVTYHTRSFPKSGLDFLCTIAGWPIVERIVPCVYYRRSWTDKPQEVWRCKIRTILWSLSRCNQNKGGNDCMLSIYFRSSLLWLFFFGEFLGHTGIAFVISVCAFIRILFAVILSTVAGINTVLHFLFRWRLTHISKTILECIIS